MAIKKFNDYSSTKAYTEVQQLPRGGYVLKIMGAEVKENSNGQYVQIGCDIAEGEFKGFFENDYRNQKSEDKKWHCNYLLNVPKDDGTEQDGWTKRRFKTIMEALEANNQGYHFDWDEKKMKGKIIGGLFNMREYRTNNGEVRMFSNLAQLCDAETVRKGTFKLPPDKLLKSSFASPASSANDGFMNIPEGSGDCLPFD